MSEECTAIQERCKMYSATESSITKMITKGCNVDTTVYVNQLVLIRKDVKENNDELRKSAIAMLNFIINLKLDSIEVYRELVKILEDSGVDDELKKLILKEFRDRVSDALAEDIFDCESVFTPWKNADCTKIMKILQLCVSELPKEKCKKILLQHMLPNLFSLSNMDIKNPLTDAAFVMLSFVSVTDLDKHELTEFRKDVADKYIKAVGDLREMDYNNWHKLWILLIRFCAKTIHNSMDITNRFLRVVEFAFRNSSFQERLKGYDCWKELINNASLDMEHMCSAKQIKLLVTPLKAKFSKQEVVICKRFDVFVYLLEKLQQKSIVCITEFLEFCFGAVSENKDLTKTGQGRTVQQIWKKSILVLMEIIGHGHNNLTDCVPSQEIVKFTRPVVNSNNIINYHKVITNSVGEACILVKNSFPPVEQEMVVKCLWKSFFNLVIPTDSSVRNQCFPNVDKILNGWIKEKVTDSFYNKLLETVFITFLSYDIELIEDDVYSLWHSVVAIVLMPDSDTFLQENSEIIEHFNQLILHGIENKKIKAHEVVKLLNSSTSTDHINVDFAIDIWLQTGKQLCSDTPVGETEITKECVPFLVWPAYYLHKLKSVKRNIIIEEWAKVYRKLTGNDENRKLSLVKQLERIFKNNPLLSTNLISLLAIISQFEQKFEIDLVFKITDLSSSLLTIPNLQKDDQFRLSSIILGYLNLSLPFYNVSDNQDVVENLCKCLKHILCIHKDYTVLETLNNFLQEMPNSLKVKFIKVLTGMLPDLLKLETVSGDINSSSINKLLKMLDINKKDKSSPNTFAAPSGRSARIAIMGKNTPLSPNPKIKKAAPTALRLFGQDLDTMSPLKVKGSLLNTTPLKTNKTVNSPKNNNKTPSIMDEKSSDFVPIDTEVKMRPDKLSEHQKEVLKRRREDIPALYQDLSQSQSQDIFVDKSSNSETEPPKIDVDVIKDEDIQMRTDDIENPPITNGVDDDQLKEEAVSQQTNYHLEDANVAAILNTEEVNKLVASGDAEILDDVPRNDDNPLCDTETLLEDEKQDLSETTNPKIEHDTVKVDDNALCDTESVQESQVVSQDSQNVDTESVQESQVVSQDSQNVAISETKVMETKENSENNPDPAIEPAKKRKSYSRIDAELKKIKMDIVGADQFVIVNLPARRTRTSEQLNKLKLRSGLLKGDSRKSLPDAPKVPSRTPRRKSLETRPEKRIRKVSDESQHNGNRDEANNSNRTERKEPENKMAVERIKKDVPNSVTTPKSQKSRVAQSADGKRRKRSQRRNSIDNLNSQTESKSLSEQTTEEKRMANGKGLDEGSDNHEEVTPRNSPKIIINSDMNIQVEWIKTPPKLKHTPEKVQVVKSPVKIRNTPESKKDSKKETNENIATIAASQDSEDIIESSQESYEGITSLQSSPRRSPRSFSSSVLRNSNTHNKVNEIKRDITHYFTRIEKKAEKVAQPQPTAEITKVVSPVSTQENEPVVEPQTKTNEEIGEEDIFVEPQSEANDKMDVDLVANEVPETCLDEDITTVENICPTDHNEMNEDTMSASPTPSLPETEACGEDYTQPDTETCKENEDIPDTETCRDDEKELALEVCTDKGLLSDPDVFGDYESTTNAEAVKQDGTEADTETCKDVEDQSDTQTCPEASVTADTQTCNTEDFEADTCDSDLELITTVVQKETKNDVPTLSEANCEEVNGVDGNNDVLSTPISKRFTLPSSPVTGDTPTRTSELFSNTLEISPISSESKKRYTSDNVIELFSAVDFVQKIPEQEIDEKVESVTVEETPKQVNNVPSERASRLLNLIKIDSPVTHRVVHRKRFSLGMSPSTGRIQKLMSTFNCNKQEAADELPQNVKQEDILTFTREVPSPLAVPKSGILKRKLSDAGEDGYSPCAKRKRVNFSYPTTTSKKVYIKDTSEFGHKERLALEAKVLFNMDTTEDQPEINNGNDALPTTEETDDCHKNSNICTESEEVITPESLQITNALLLESNKPIYPNLVGCEDDIFPILRRLSSPMYVTTMLHKLFIKNIKTVGDLAQKSEAEVNRLPFRAPAINTVYKVLDSYYKKNVLKEFKISKTTKEESPIREIDASIVAVENEVVANGVDELDNADHHSDCDANPEVISEKVCEPIAVGSPPLEETVDIMERFKKLLEKAKSEEVSLCELGTTLLEHCSEEQALDLLKSSTVDKKELLPEIDIQNITEYLVRSAGLPKMFEMVTDTIQSTEDEAVFFDCVIKHSIDKKPLSALLETRSLDDIKIGIDEIIEKGQFSRENIVQTCFIPLVRSPEDIYEYLNKLTVVQVGDIVVNKLQSEELSGFVDRLKTAFGSENIAKCIDKKEALKLCSKEDITNEIVQNWSGCDILHSFKQIISHLSKSDSASVIEMFRYVSCNVPSNILIDAHIEFLQKLKEHNE